MWLKFGEYPWGVEIGVDMYMFNRFSVCLCNCMRMDWISIVLSCVLAVVLVKGMDSSISVMRPPPPRVVRSCLSVV